MERRVLGAVGFGLIAAGIVVAGEPEGAAGPAVVSRALPGAPVRTCVAPGWQSLTGQERYAEPHRVGGEVVGATFLPSSAEERLEQLVMTGPRNPCDEWSSRCGQWSSRDDPREASDGGRLPGLEEIYALASSRWTASCTPARFLCARS
jgi:hypothetical protein